MVLLGHNLGNSQVSVYRTIGPTLVNIYVSCSGLITSVGEDRAIFLLSFTCNYVVSVRRGFLFLLVFRIGCVVL